jgi:hypothetical protein
MTNLPTTLADGSPIPKMVEAVLSPSDLTALLADLAALTTITDVLCKAAPQQLTPEQNLTLQSATELFLARQVMAMQIRYQYDGSAWTDTVLHAQPGYRLVRCQHIL